MFLQWQPQTKIAREYGLGNRQIVFRHAKALGLFEKRATNIRGMFVALVERGLDIPRLKVPPATIVQAAIALSKLDSERCSVDRFQRVSADSAFLDDPRWTVGEMERFAEKGELPKWLKSEMPDTQRRAFEASARPN